MLIVAIVAACVRHFPTENSTAGHGKNLSGESADYLQQFHPQGRVFNDCLWGGYLIWNVRHIPVFIDSRIDIYEYNGVFADYLDLTQLNNSLGVWTNTISGMCFSERQPRGLPADEHVRLEDEISGRNDGIAGAHRTAGDGRQDQVALIA